MTDHAVKAPEDHCHWMRNFYQLNLAGKGSRNRYWQMALTSLIRVVGYMVETQYLKGTTSRDFYSGFWKWCILAHSQWL